MPQPAKRYVDFYTSEQQSFAIDPDSINIQPGAEYEFRFTLKSTSKQGAINLSYEGIKCNTRQKIIYAIGRSDGTWSRVKYSDWRAIYTTGVNIQHATLANDYFCSGNSIAGSLSAILKRLEKKQPMTN